MKRISAILAVFTALSTSLALPPPTMTEDAPSVGRGKSESMGQLKLVDNIPFDRQVFFKGDSTAIRLTGTHFNATTVVVRVNGTLLPKDRIQTDTKEETQKWMREQAEYEDDISEAYAGPGNRSATSALPSPEQDDAVREMEVAKAGPPDDPATVPVRAREKQNRKHIDQAAIKAVIVNALVPGKNELVITASDNKGRKLSCSRTLYFYPDNTVPVSAHFIVVLGPAGPKRGPHYSSQLEGDSLVAFHPDPMVPVFSSFIRKKLAESGGPVHSAVSNSDLRNGYTVQEFKAAKAGVATISIIKSSSFGSKKTRREIKVTVTE